MTEKLHGLTKQEITRLQRAMRWVEDNASLLRPYRRIRGQQIRGSSSGVRFAFCKEDAPTTVGNAITAYLDTNLTGEEITVGCFMFESTKLSACVPLLKTGNSIPVVKIGDYWYCTFSFIGTTVCDGET